MTQEAARKAPKREVQFQDEAKARRNRKPGRPANPDGPALAVYVAVTKLRRWLRVVERMNEQPRAARNRNAIRDLALEIAERLGPAADPAWKPEQRRNIVRTSRDSVRWEITGPDGSVTSHPTVKDAAARWGSKPNSLTVMLSRGKGKATKRVYVGGEQGYGVMTCRRVETGTNHAT